MNWLYRVMRDIQLGAKRHQSAGRDHVMNERSADTGWRVDRRCTNCDVARQLAPGLVAEVGGRSSVIRQPRTDAEDKALYAAAFACHTRSIRHGARLPESALDPFPLPLAEHVHVRVQKVTGSWVGRWAVCDFGSRRALTR